MDATAVPISGIRLPSHTTGETIVVGCVTV